MATDNPFEPPRAPLGEPVEEGKGSLVLAVVVGASIDFLGSMIAGFALVMVYALVLSSQGLSLDEIQAQIRSDELKPLGITLGALMSFLGGYFAAAIARARAMPAAVLVGCTSCLVGVVAGGKHYPWWGNVLLALLTFGAVLCGAWMRRARRR